MSIGEITLIYSNYTFEYIEETDDYKVFRENGDECTDAVKNGISKEADEIIKEMVKYWSFRVRHEYGF